MLANSSILEKSSCSILVKNLIAANYSTAEFGNLAPASSAL